MPDGWVHDRTILDAAQMRQAIARLAGEIVDSNQNVADLLLIGVRTRGVPLAEALADQIEAASGIRPAIGILDITLYRDDLSTIAPQPVVKETYLPSDIDSRALVLCDDVLYTGRTIRAALGALVDYGRPRRVELAVLIDRGLRELPIQADFVGLRVDTTADEQVEVHFPSTDGDELVEILVRQG